MVDPTLIVKGRAMFDARVAKSGAIYFDISYTSNSIPAYFKVFVNSTSPATRQDAENVRKGDSITVVGAYTMVIVDWEENGVACSGPQPRLVVYRDQPDERGLVDGITQCKTMVN